MWIEKIKINNFRNYKSQEINFNKNINIFFITLTPENLLFVFNIYIQLYHNINNK